MKSPYVQIQKLKPGQGPIPESERDIAHALGQRRFDHFINQIAKKLRRRRSLVAESLRWEQSEPEEAKPQ